jgi:Beta-lactamase
VVPVTSASIGEGCACFDQHGDVGASTAVVYKDEVVVDLWGGHLDVARTKPWERDTIILGFGTAHSHSVARASA